MKLFVSYIVFDGIELLEASINQIRDQVDIIQVIYQNTSWFNKQILKEDLEILYDLKKRKLIDKLDCFTNFKFVDLNSTHYIRIIKRYETAKRDFGLKTARLEKATHFMSMDVDEFYKPIEFYKAKEIVEENDFELTSCKFINYVNTPEYQRGYDSKVVPFICKINEYSRIGQGFFAECDPTRGITPGENTFEFNPGLISMHHMETVRKNLKHKYESTTRYNLKRNEIDKLVENIKGSTTTVNFGGIIYPGFKEAQKLVKVENYFNIQI